MLRAFVLSTILLLCACGNQQPSVAKPLSDNACDEPRPQVCTMEYNPVCGVISDGQRQSYSSPCNACAHDEVTSFEPGRCEGDS
ncbi:MAG: hypothetical protein ACK5ME_08820 [Parahaliea sp.]